MSALPRPDPMTLQQYLAWEAKQERKHEFIDGRPRAMAGAAKRHNLMCSNIIAALHRASRGKHCRPFGSDLKLLSPTGNARYPDVQVDCARLSAREVYSTEPRVVIEVISPSNDWIETQRLLADYQAHPDVVHILFVSSLKLGGQLWSREEGEWVETILEDLQAVFELPAIEASLSMAEICEDVDFTEAEPD
jgi:Uma2 family endonuclease